MIQFSGATGKAKIDKNGKLYHLGHLEAHFLAEASGVFKKVPKGSVSLNVTFGHFLIKSALFVYTFCALKYAHFCAFLAYFCTFCLETEPVKVQNHRFCDFACKDRQNCQIPIPYRSSCRKTVYLQNFLYFLSGNGLYLPFR